MAFLLRVACLAIVGLSALADRAVADGRPNIVIIVSDDQGWGDYGFMGHPKLETPRLDRLSQESLTFTRGYVPCSLCRPSLAALISGHYPHETGIVGNDPRLPAELAALNPRQRLADPGYAEYRRRYSENLRKYPTLPALLTINGYLTFQAGKWWELDYRHGGFTHGMTHGDPARAGRHGDLGLQIGRETMQPVTDFLDLAVGEGKPFMVFYAPMMPHLPHTPPERLLAKSRERTDHIPEAKYWAMCEWFDESVGQLLDAIDERGLAENTLIIYLADNGWTQPLDEEPRAFGAARGKRTPYDGGLRTPLLIRWPGKVAARRDEERLASSLDLLPTILNAAGIESPSALPGIDLLDERSVAARSAIYGATYDHDATFPTKPAETLQYRWVIAGDWKLIQPAPRMTDAPTELFQITADPGEGHNLAENEAERVRELRSRLDEWWTPPVSDATDDDPAAAEPVR